MFALASCGETAGPDEGAVGFGLAFLFAVAGSGGAARFAFEAGS